MSAEKEVPDYWRNINFSVRPEVAGSGGEHTVFARLTREGYVTKVNRNLVAGYLVGELGIRDLELEIVRRNKRQSILGESFGPRHVLPENFDLMEVMLSGQEIAKIM